MARPKSISDEALLDIARECFFTEGPQVPTRVIAERAGISQPALFKRFKTKEELFMAALATKETLTNLLTIIGWLRDNPKPGDLQPQLEELHRRVLDLMYEILPRALAMQSSGIKITPEKFFAMFKKPPPVRLLESIGEFVRNAQKNGQMDPSLHPEVAAMTILAPMQARVFFCRILGFRMDMQTDDEYIKQTAKVLCQGFSRNGGSNK